MEALLLLFLQIGFPSTSDNDRDFDRINRRIDRVLDSYDRDEMMDYERRQTEALEKMTEGQDRYRSVVIAPDDSRYDSDERGIGFPYRDRD